MAAFFSALIELNSGTSVMLISNTSPFKSSAHFCSKSNFKTNFGFSLVSTEYLPPPNVMSAAGTPICCTKAA
ncbi:hypothetical protein ACJIZ3_018741 [Penstemon smallii]|uniref:Uncharacterized protein n=1 Tax=Penstemon smallii TaxID=265156 RepID=A0ABD3SZ83_9LAMI